MGIQVHVENDEFTRKGGVLKETTNTKWVWIEEIQDEVQEEITATLYQFPSGLVAISYHPDALVFDMRPNMQFVEELNNMGVPFIQS